MMIFYKGCHLAAGNVSQAERLFVKVKSLLKLTLKSGKELPAEAFVRKRISFYEKKQSDGDSIPSRVSRTMIINGAEEIAVFWNIHNRISTDAAESRIREWASLDPLVFCESSPLLRTAKEKPHEIKAAPLSEGEINLRNLLLGVVLRTSKQFEASRHFLKRVIEEPGEQFGWMCPLSAFELAVLELQERSATESSDKRSWINSLQTASTWLTKASSLCHKSLDMSTRLEFRIAILQEEIKLKRTQLDDL